MTSHDSVAQLFARYGWANDMKDLEMLEQCFSEDISFVGTIAGAPAFGPFESRPTALEFFEAVFEAATGQSRHVITNFRLTDGADGAVRVFAYLTFCVTEGGVFQPKTTGVYDCLLSDSGEPQFRSMNLALDGPL